MQASTYHTNSATLIDMRRYSIKSIYWKIGEDKPKDKNEFLKPYFSDLHGLFMDKVAALPAERSFTIEQEKRLRQLFDEVLEVKALLSDREDKW